MQVLIARLEKDYPHLRFRPGQSFCWCPGTKEVYYRATEKPTLADKWSLLHEVCHATLGHSAYLTDLELLQLEVDAWEAACKLAATYELIIDEDYKQDCIDTYRDWLYRRSVCPTCGTQNLQADIGREYQCYNCHTAWQVSNSRFSRPYRRGRTAGHTTAPQNNFVFI